MYKSIAAITSLAVILSLGSLIPAQAGGGATSAPSKYNNAGQNQSQAARYSITEFSSSSARKATPKR